MQQQAESKATEPVERQHQGEKDVAHQLQQPDYNTGAELSAVTGHHAKRGSAKQAEVQCVEQVSSLSRDPYCSLLPRVVLSVLVSTPFADYAVQLLCRALAILENLGLQLW